MLECCGMRFSGAVTYRMLGREWLILIISYLDFM